MDPDYVDGRLVYTVGAAVFLVLLILSCAYFFVFASPPEAAPAAGTPISGSSPRVAQPAADSASPAGSSAEGTPAAP